MELGCLVAVEVAPVGKRLRPRSKPPLPDGSWQQRRITTANAEPAGLQPARKHAVKLDRDSELR